MDIQRRLSKHCQDVRTEPYRGIFVSIQVCEIFKSIQGESSFVGLPCSFVRLSGCNLHCSYCDTSYARSGGREMELREILDHVKSHGIGLVEITGGEPLVQDETPLLAHLLITEGYLVLVETNGSLDISVLPESAIRIIDIKCPSSGQSHCNRRQNMGLLRPIDEVKFVVCDRTDYEWARDVFEQSLRGLPNTVLMSPVHGALAPRDLAQWILEDHLNVRLQIQLHKYVWPPHARGV